MCATKTALWSPILKKVRRKVRENTTIQIGAESVYGEITYYISNNALISINVRDKNGVVVANLEKGTAKGSGEYNYSLALSVKGWPKGEYEIAVYEDYSRLIKRVKFTL